VVVVVVVLIVLGFESKSVAGWWSDVLIIWLCLS
jgi:hypothetical protein